jgi:hypothetical protein
MFIYITVLGKNKLLNCSQPPPPCFQNEKDEVVVCRDQVAGNRLGSGHMAIPSSSLYMGPVAGWCGPLASAQPSFPGPPEPRSPPVLAAAALAAASLAAASLAAATSVHCQR